MFWFVLCDELGAHSCAHFHLAVNADPCKMKPETKSVDAFTRNMEWKVSGDLLSGLI